ncbi:MAG: hypothetical protein Q4C54_07530 [Clostridia bacterium]|nr:hypothetical protein [Clostridia bacterium]
MRCALLLTENELSGLGSAVLSERGEVVGVIVSQWAGDRAYVMAPLKQMPADLLALRGTDTPQWQQMDAATSSVLKPLEVRATATSLNISWNPDMVDTRLVRIWITNIENSFTSVIHAMADKGTAEVEVPEGIYAVCAFKEDEIAADQTEPETEDIQFVRVECPGAYTDYEYRDKVDIIALDSDVTPDENTAAVPVKDCTDIVGDEGKTLYLRVLSMYRVEEEITLPLMITLTAPDGQVYFHSARFIFVPSIQDNDVWYDNITQLMDDCRRMSGLKEGTYTVRYYIDGRRCGQAEIEIK